MRNDPRMQALIVSNHPDGNLAGPPMLEGDLMNLVALGMAGPMLYQDLRFNNLRVLHLQDIRFLTVQGMRWITTMLQAIPILDVLSFENAFADLAADDIANQHHLVSTNIRRMVFDHCAGIDTFLTCIGIPVDIEIFIEGSKGNVLPNDNGMRGGLKDCDAAVVTVVDNKLCVGISKGTSKLTAEWTYRSGHWEDGFERLMRGVRELTIHSREMCNTVQLYHHTPKIERLCLDLHHGRTLDDAVLPCGIWTNGTRLYFSQLRSLRELRFVADRTWTDILETAGTVFKTRDALGYPLQKVFIDTGRPNEPESMRKSPKDWERAEEELRRLAHRVADRHRRVTEDERGH